MKLRRLLFIQKQWNKVPGEQSKPTPKYLDICISTNERLAGSHDDRGNRIEPGIYYQIAGCDPRSGFHESMFIELPSFESEEINEKEHEAIIYQR